jgi:hypothetical protein
MRRETASKQNAQSAGVGDMTLCTSFWRRPDWWKRWVLKAPKGNVSLIWLAIGVEQKPAEGFLVAGSRSGGKELD